MEKKYTLKRDCDTHITEICSRTRYKNREIDIKDLKSNTIK